MAAAYWIGVFLLGGLAFIGPAYAMGRRDERRRHRILWPVVNYARLDRLEWGTVTLEPERPNVVIGTPLYDQELED